MARWTAVLAALLPLAVAASNEVTLQSVQRRLQEVSQQHEVAQKQLKEVSDDLREMEMYMRQLRRSTKLALEDGAKKDQVLSDTFHHLHPSNSPNAPRPHESLAQEAEKVKRQESSAAEAVQRAKDLQWKVQQQQETFQAQKAQLAQKQKEILELQKAVSRMQAEAREDVAADQELQRKYAEQAQEYQKDVEHLAGELSSVKEQLSRLKAQQHQDAEGMAEGKRQLQENEGRLRLQQQKRAEEERHEDAILREVVGLKDDLDSSLLSVGGAVAGSHEQRLTQVVRLAGRKQQEIGNLEANISGVEAAVHEETLQLDQLKEREALDAGKLRDEIQEVRQKKLYRVRAAQDMYHRLPEIFQQRAQLDEVRRAQEAQAAQLSRAQQGKLREAKLRDTEKEEEEELHTELRSSKQRLQSIAPQANSKRSVAKKRLQQLRAKLQATKREEAKELKQFMQRSSALQKELQQDEAKNQRKTNEKAKAVEKMQGDLLSLEDKIDSLGRQQNQLASEAAQLQSSLSLKQMQDQQDLHHAKLEADRLEVQEKEKEKQQQSQVHRTQLHWTSQLHDEELQSQTQLQSVKHHLEEKVTELRSSDAADQQQLLTLAQQLRVKQLAAGKMQKFLEREPPLASTVKRTLKME